jgi:hypothetical protein
LLEARSGSVLVEQTKLYSSWSSSEREYSNSCAKFSRSKIIVCNAP